MSAMPQTKSIGCPGTVSNAEKLWLQPRSLVYDIAQGDPLALGCRVRHNARPRRCFVWR